MAATSLTRSYERLLTTTSDLYHKSGLVQDNIFQSNPVFHCLHGKADGIRHEDAGGDFIKCGTMYEANGNVDSYSGADILDDTIQDGMTAAFYPWAQYSGANVITGINKFQNMGRAKIVDLWQQIYKQTMYSMQERLNVDLLDIDNWTAASEATGNGGKNIIGLPGMISHTPSAAGTFGKINQANEAWWRNKIKDGSAAFGHDLFREMQTVYNDCSKGGMGAPDIIISDQVSYELYVTYMDHRIRYEYTDTPSAGFENVRYLGAKMFWDVYTPDMKTPGNGADGTTLTKGSMFFLNSKALDLYVGKGLDFAPQGVKTAERQDILREYVLAYLQLVTNNRRKHGVLFDIDPALNPVATS